MKKVDRLFVNDVIEFLNDANGYAPTKKSVNVLFNCLDYSDNALRYSLCKINKVVYLFKYYENNTDEYMTMAVQGNVNDILCEDIIDNIVKSYNYEHARVYIGDIIKSIKENTVEVELCYELEKSFDFLRRCEMFGKFGYFAVDDIKNEIDAETDTDLDIYVENIEANYAMKICKEDTENIYKSGDRVMSNTYFTAQACEYFNCKSKEIYGVQTYCPLRDYQVCDANSYCGIESAIFTYSGIYYAAFHVRNDVYELHRISDKTYKNMARLMIYDVYPRTTRWIAKTNLDVRRGQADMPREDIMDICMMRYRKKIHDTREMEY